MKYTKLSHILALSILFLSGMATVSCSLVEEKYTDCPTGLFIRFVYDYNTMRADMFKDHVGHVQVYIFDENGRLAAERSVSNTDIDAPLSRYGYTMHFTPEELPAGHSYRIQAVAMQRDWNDALSTLGAKYRHSASPTEHSESMMISLDHHNVPIDGTEQFEVSNAAPLDTLWHTLKVIPHAPVDDMSVPDIDRTAKPYSIYPVEDQMVRVEKEKATYATVSLIRDTKHLNITLRHVDEPETVFATDYEIKIVDNNAHVSHDNTVLTHDSLRYTPYASWTSRLLDDNTVEIEDIHTGNPGQYHAPAIAESGERRAERSTRDLEDADSPTVLQRTAHYNMMFNRLMLDTEEIKNNASLEIHNKKTGDLVARVNLPYILSQGRQAYEIQNYGSQEYLDREHDYHLDFFLKGSTWIAIEIHVLSWSKRVQNVEF
ncbi:MAG: FimB/Mfa2 family fimbrial subunit [Muribaculaceae bacterium]|nr:FimB/Mfa2 family fimbrial subunit [Muribaculaceae bacterium]